MFRRESCFAGESDPGGPTHAAARIVSATGGNGPALLEGKDLELWRGERRLFTGVTFELRAGELLHIVGPNGCGKTSLLRVLCGLTLPETGDVFWCSRKVQRNRADFHASTCYLGHRESLKADLTAEENLVFQLGLRCWLSKADIHAALDKVGLTRQREVPARSLSAGQKRRVSLARALASGARLWVLDEPYTNLDIAGRELVDQMMNEHLRRDGLVLLVAHQSHGVNAGVTRRLELG
jgi:heme exporter protein A